MTTPIAAGTTRRIRPSRGWATMNLKEVWEYRELLYFLAWRDIKVRYKQTVLGVAWAALQPVFTLIIFSVIFGWLVKVPSDDVPYPFFAFCALLPWQLFTSSMSATSNSLVANQHLITKIAFPRLVIPLSAAVVSLLDFSIAFLVLLAMMVFYKITPTIAMLTLPIFILLTMATAFGIGTWLSSLNVKYRDVRHILPFLTQGWMFATPVLYSSILVPEPWRLLYALNPMVGAIEGFRWALLGTNNASGPMVLVSTSVTVMLLLSGVCYFHRKERTFADRV
ncbi:MAG: ABC transporter permease [Nitrospira sp.]|nr:ABC transporter permease [Nitrospira sp.]MDH4302469.1 ABC transporter permease [Nitrospira sp.]MDH5192245.1 ABC transporter permease [Nitrospira sp.]